MKGTLVVKAERRSACHISHFQVFLENIKPDRLYYKLNNSLICGKNYENYGKHRAKKYLVQNVF